MGYLRLSDYGLIGNEASCALVSRLGSVDWCCFPYIDSPSHFAAILDDSRGGKFQIVPQGDFSSEQRYLHRTNVLETAFETAFGRAVITDWMPMDESSREEPVLFRCVEVIEGRVLWALTVAPRFQYGSKPASVERLGDRLVFRGSSGEELAILKTDIPCRISADGSFVTARFSLERGQAAKFIWSWGRRGRPPIMLSPNVTAEHWRQVAHRCPESGCPFGGPWHDLVVRSGLTLKLLINRFSGAIAESVTTSIPGVEQSGRNWDLRYSWIREGALAMRALSELGSTREMDDWFIWLTAILERDGAEGLQPLYRLDGSREISERELPHLNGYRGCKPVRIGNAAATQFKLDTYGHVLLAAAEYFRAHQRLPDGLWEKLVELTEFVCRAWRRPDHGPWESRGKPEHFVASKVMCWVTLDRAIRLGASLAKATPKRWESEKEILYRAILEQGFYEAGGYFVRAFGSRELDASAVLIPWLGFLPHDDPRVVSTLQKIEEQLSTDVFVHKSGSGTGTGPREGASLASSFLFIGCLARMGRIDEAAARMEELCAYATPLGLLGDQVDLQIGETTGNFPSALVLLTLVRAAYEIGVARGRQNALLLEGLTRVHAAEEKQGNRAK